MKRTNIMKRWYKWLMAHFRTVTWYLYLAQIVAVLTLNIAVMCFVCLLSLAICGTISYGNALGWNKEE